jgi:hypothetical protein
MDEFLSVAGIAELLKLKQTIRNWIDNGNRRENEYVKGGSVTGGGRVQKKHCRLTHRSR